MRALYLDRAGSAIWGAMKNDVRDHFAAGGAGTEFLERLESDVFTLTHIRSS